MARKYRRNNPFDGYGLPSKPLSDITEGSEASSAGVRGFPPQRTPYRPAPRPQPQPAPSGWQTSGTYSRNTIERNRYKAYAETGYPPMQPYRPMADRSMRSCPPRVGVDERAGPSVYALAMKEETDDFQDFLKASRASRRRRPSFFRKLFCGCC